jgi:hypothetical protein
MIGELKSKFFNVKVIINSMIKGLFLREFLKKEVKFFRNKFLCI